MPLAKHIILFMMNKRLFILAAVALSSCSTLTESQIKNINAFGTSAKSYSAFPSEVFRQKAVLRFNEALVNTTVMATPNLMKQSLDRARTTYSRELQLSDKFDLSLQLIQQYAGLLAKLSSESFVENLEKNTTDLSENLSSLVTTFNTKLPGSKLPDGVATGVSRAIFLVGRQLTRSRQAKELKRFIPQGDVLIQATAKNLVDVFETDTPSVKMLLEGDRTAFINTYTNLILSDSSKVNYNSVRRYSEALTDYDNLEALRQQCVAAARQLAAAHGKLNQNIAKKTELREIFKETQDLIASVRELSKLYKALHNTPPSATT
jgi:hypothetical protein